MSLRLQSFKEYQEAQRTAKNDPDGFWDGIASQFQWIKPHHQTRSGSLQGGDLKWFVGGRLNITVNALDRHAIERGNQSAIIWEPNDPNHLGQTLSYKELYERVCDMGAALRASGVQKGDRVILYMPMTPELAVSVLACARIGAIHSVVFAGFSAQALADRIQDAGATVVITANEGRRGPKIVPLKSTVDEALEHCPTVQLVIVQRAP